MKMGITTNFIFVLLDVWKINIKMKTCKVGLTLYCLDRNGYRTESTNGDGAENFRNIVGSPKN